MMAYNVLFGIKKTNKTPNNTNGNACRIVFRASVVSISPKAKNARAELERPNYSVISPSFTVSTGAK